MILNQSSNFRHRALEIFDQVLNLEIIVSTDMQEKSPSTSLDESSVESDLETDDNLY